VTTLNGDINNAVTTVTVTDGTSIPAGVGFLIQIDNEQMNVTAKSTNTLTVMRAANGTTAGSHSNGAAVNPAFDQRDTGFPRKIGSAVDIGAFEACAAPATPPASNGGPYCEGATISLSTPTVSGATYSWSGPNGFTSALQNPTLSNAATADAGTYSVTVTVNGCTSAAGTTNVVVNATPATPTASNGGPYVAGATIQLSTPMVTGATYSWTGPNGFTSSQQNPTRSNATTADAGTYSVTVTVNGCTSAAGTTDVVVNSPTASSSTVTGHIVDSDGNPVEGAGIRMNGTQNRLTVTDANGNYHFDNVDTDGLYTVTPSRANSAFSPSQRTFSQIGQHTDAAFSAAYNGGTANPLDTTEYFVRQQYVDFLSREPDEAGLNFWVNNLEACGSDQDCLAAKRIDTSAAFFLSIEFQQTGYLIHRTYQAAYGDIPNTPVPVRLEEFQPDTRAIGSGVVVNQGNWETMLDNNKQAFMTAFVTRPRFAAAYPTTMGPSEFVDKLFANAGVTPSEVERTAAVSEFRDAAENTADTAARGRALRRVAENRALAQKEFSSAFVLMQYFGYLRRDPNTGPDTNFDGYNFWLTKLNTFNGSFRQAEMVKSFLVAGEYRQRFPR